MNDIPVMTLPFIRFLAGAVIISLSGVMAPGPMTAVTIGKGSESPRAGALIALGHGIVEFPLMAGLFLGFGYFFNLPAVKPLIGFAGGLVLLAMAIGMFRGFGSHEVAGVQDRRSPVVAGVFLTAANPYFLIWWATIGAAMVIQSAEFGTAGLLIFMVMHWACDLVWCWILSALSFRGRRFFGRNFQKSVFGVSGVALVIFSGKFIYDALMSLI